LIFYLALNTNVFFIPCITVYALGFGLYPIKSSYLIGQEHFTML